MFFKNTMEDPQSPIESVTQDDLNRIVDAARAVGDDHIQQQQGGRVVPESWTHGSSKMRQYWVAKGFQSGDPNTCDTFNTNDLGIAIGSAAALAADFRIDSRVMFSVGQAVLDLNLLPECSMVLALPLSVSRKSIFFDRG